ncbi:MAG: dephospho-CoA kinase [Thermodesulfobacteriota bacterium]
MFIVGLTGGVASGKSLVSKVWKEEGAALIDADQIARELVRPGTPAWKVLVKTFGKEILQEDDSIDRKKLAARVFSNPIERDLLNHILHPRIKREIDRRIKEIGRRNPRAIVVIDAALLVETGYYRNVDRLVVVTSTREQQLERLRRRDAIDQEMAQGIIDAQIRGEDRIKVADLIIRNEGSHKETERKAREVFGELKRIALQERRETSRLQSPERSGRQGKWDAPQGAERGSPNEEDWK